ncbi:MAG: hypothetical protein OXG35_32475 [Acidobacteria bacterium]|nr:hypothetical protein [Acidobacteriota bacterium]
MSDAREHAAELVREARVGRYDIADHAMRIAAGNLDAGNMTEDYARRLLLEVARLVWRDPPESGGSS